MHILTIKRNSYPASLAATTKKAFAAVTIMLSMLMSAQTLRAMPQHSDMADAPGKVGYRTIVRVDSVTVNAPAGRHFDKSRRIDIYGQGVHSRRQHHG